MMLAVAAFVALTAFSATVDDLFNYVEKQGGSVIDLSKELMQMMMQQQAGKEASGLKNIESMKMGMFEKATAAQKAGLKALAEEGVEGYVDVNTILAAMGANDDDEGTKIFIKMDPQTEEFTSFVIVTLEDKNDEIGVVQMDGELTLDDLNKMQ